MRRIIVIAAPLIATMGATLLIAIHWHHRQPSETVVREPLILIVSADTAGWIMPCGCTANQSGGLLRRATYLDRLRKDGTGVFYCDAGGAPAGTSEYQKAKFEAVLAGEREMGISAHNIGRSEAMLGPDYLRDIALRLKVPLISTNTRDTGGKAIGEPVVIIRHGGWSIAVVGVLAPAFATPQLVVADPREAVLSTLAPLKGTYDGLIVLAYLSEPALRQLATDLPEADAVIGGPTSQAFAPRLVGPTLVGASTNKGKFLVRLDIPAHAERWSGDVVEMGPDIPDAPVQQENLHRYLAQLALLDLSAAQSELVEPVAPGAPHGYRIAGSNSCAKCHPVESVAWSASGHAHAWEKLKARGFDVDPSCQQCHTTGYGLPDGFESVRKSRNRVDVGCEDCHGPSQAHATDPTVRTPFAGSAQNQCVRCHDHENSPHFDFNVFWPKIAHGTKGRP